MREISAKCQSVIHSSELVCSVVRRRFSFLFGGKWMWMVSLLHHVYHALPSHSSARKGVCMLCLQFAIFPRYLLLRHIDALVLVSNNRSGSSTSWPTIQCRLLQNTNKISQAAAGSAITRRVVVMLVARYKTKQVGEHADRKEAAIASHNLLHQANL
jgi:hypothetical protein